MRLHVWMSEDSFWEVERSVYFYVGLWMAKWRGTKAGHCSLSCVAQKRKGLGVGIPKLKVQGNLLGRSESCPGELEE